MDKTLISTVEAPEKSSPHWAGCQFEVEKKYWGLFLSSSLPIKLILYLSRTSGFNESRRKFGMKKNVLREMIFFDISTTPPFWSPLYSLSSLIYSVLSCCLLWPVICSAHRNKSHQLPMQTVQLFPLLQPLQIQSGQTTASNHKHTCKLTFTKGPQWK